MNSIAEFFCQAYYALYDAKNWSSLTNLYSEDAQMTFEGTLYSGQTSIYNKFNSLQFQTIQHLITAIDCQSVGSNILIHVFGQINTDNDPTKSFSQTFVLTASGESYSVSNDIFRLILHNE